MMKLTMRIILWLFPDLIEFGQTCQKADEAIERVYKNAANDGVLSALQGLLNQVKPVEYDKYRYFIVTTEHAKEYKKRLDDFMSDVNTPVGHELKIDQMAYKGTPISVLEGLTGQDAYLVVNLTKNRL